jgi:lactate permease
MFEQPLMPIGQSLAASALVAALPVAIVLMLLGVFRRPAALAAGAGLVVALVVAVVAWGMPVRLAAASAAHGAAFALVPVAWIVVNALLLYNVAVRSGHFAAFRRWLLRHLPDDRRVLLVVVGFCFGALFEGIAGFGTPVAITASLLATLGFEAADALVYVLIFNSAPVAFGALGTPVTVLGAVTGLPADVLGATIGRQLPFIALALPFYVVFLYGGARSVRATWPLLAVAGASFGAIQYYVSNHVDYALTDVLSSLGALLACLAFLKVWRPAPDAQFRVERTAQDLAADDERVPDAHGWIPWIIVVVTVVAWSSLHLVTAGQWKVPWPLLHQAVSITLYGGRPYDALWVVQPLGTGTAILVATLLTAAAVRLGPAAFAACVATTFRQYWRAAITVMLIIALAYLMNYSGLAYTLGLALASTGTAFVLLSPFLGWLAVMLSGSDSAGNALFGNLQVVAARQLQLDPVLFAAANSSGGVTGKMVSPQNIATGIALTSLQGRDGEIFARTFPHSVLLTLLLSGIVALQQFVLPAMIAH